VFISHDLSAVERLCDRAALLDKGVVVSQGLPADVIANYHHRISTADSEASGVARADCQSARAHESLVGRS
jgi:ABC-type glutathione transport system ATPase component